MDATENCKLSHPRYPKSLSHFIMEKINCVDLFVISEEYREKNRLPGEKILFLCSTVSICSPVVVVVVFIGKMNDR